MTLNMDGSKYLERIIPVLREEQPDVLCLQEAYVGDLSAIQKVLGGESVLWRFAGMTMKTECGVIRPIGIAMLSRCEVVGCRMCYYIGDENRQCELDESSLESRRKTENRLVLMFTAVKAGVRYQIATTHFTWTPDSHPNIYQRQDLQKLLEIVGEYKDCVLCGDFNAPRGGEIFAALASVMKDNVPREFITSIDSRFHKISGLIAMVDGIFTTPGYRVQNVDMIGSVSDHYALKAEILVKFP